jgi:O-antigen/teichoic acid export membrane protein
LAKGQPVDVRQYFFLKLLLSGLYVAAVCFTAWLTGIPEWSILITVVFILLFNSFFLFFRSVVTANQLFRADAWFSVLDKALMIVLSGGFIYFPLVFGPISLQLFLSTQLISTGAALVLLAGFVFFKRLFVHGAREEWLPMLKALLPFASIILLMSMHFRLDGFLLERLRSDGAYQAGVYASAYRLIDAANMIGYLAAAFLVPFVARHQHERHTLSDTLLNVQHLLLFAAIGVAGFAIVFPSWIQLFLYHTNQPFNSVVIQCSLAVLPAYFITHIYGSVLTATGILSTFIKILIVSVIANICLNLFLIPALGALGCCIAALVSQYFCAVACYNSAIYKLNLTLPRRSILQYLLIAAVLLMLLFAAKMAMLNVWLILVVATTGMLCLLALKLQVVKIKLN